MENILKMLYGLPRDKTHGPDAPLVRPARIKSENPELRTAPVTDFDRFRFAFRAGAQTMAELVECRGDAL